MNPLAILVPVVAAFLLSSAYYGLADRLGVTALGPAVVLALALWVAFPVVLLAGSVFHERVPVALAAVHAGDWLLKLLVVTAVTGLWR